MNRVSSLGMAFSALVLLFLSSGITSGVTNTTSVQSTAPAKKAAGATPAARDPQKLFEAGEAALRAGKLDEAERAFRQVLAINPGVAGGPTHRGGASTPPHQRPPPPPLPPQSSKPAAATAGG